MFELEMPRKIKAVIVTIILLTCPAAHCADRPAQSNSTKAEIFRGMARINMASGDLARAKKLVDQAAELTSKTTDPKAYASCLLDQAWLSLNTGKFDKALSECTQALELQEKAYYEKDYRLAYSLRMLATVQSKLGKFTQASKNMDCAIELMRQNFGPDHNTIASFEVEYSQVLFEAGQTARALTKCKNALGVILKTYGPEHLYTATVHAKLAEFYLSAGDTAKARNYVDLAISLQSSMYPPGHHNLVASQMIKAEILKTTGQSSRARDLAAAACESMTTTYGRNHPWLTRLAEQYPILFPDKLKPQKSLLADSKITKP